MKGRWIPRLGILLLWASFAHGVVIPCGVEISGSRMGAYHTERRGRELSGLSVIVPVYRELHSGNLERLVASLEREALDPSLDLEAVFIVNNTPGVALQPSHPARLENQATLAWLEKRAETSSVRIIGIDQSSVGVPRLIGKIRNAGVRYLSDRYPAPLNRLVGMLDADVVVPENYGQAILSAARRGKEALFLNRTYRIEPGAPDEVYATFHRFQFEFKLGGTHLSLVNELREFIKGGFPNYGSPQQVATLSALERVNGVPEVKWGEDHRLQRNLMAQVEWEYLPKVIVGISDRDRPQEGYTSSFRLLPSNLQRPERPTGTSRATSLVRGTHPEGVTVDQRLLNDLKDIPADETLALFTAISAEGTLHESGVKEIEDYLRNPSVSLATNHARLFVEGNVWISEDLDRLRREGKTADQIIDDYRRRFPDWLLPFEETPFKQVITRLSLLRDFIWEVHRRPLDYPTAASRLAEWKANLQPAEVE